MTRKQDPGQWWHRTLQWAVTAMVGVVMSIVGYVAVKWDKSADSVLVIGSKVDAMAADISEMRKNADRTSEATVRLDERMKKIEGSKWWKRQVEE